MANKAVENTKQKKRPAAKNTRGAKMKKKGSYLQWQAERPGMSAGMLGVLALACAGIVALMVLAQSLTGIREADAAPLRISEVMSSNATTLFLQDGSVPDWIEIENVSGHSVNLAGYGLVVETAPTNIFTFSTSALPAGGRMLVYADGNLSAGADHAPFRLKAGGGKIALVNQGGTGLDTVQIPEMAADQSYARDEDGAWQVTDVPTPGEENSVARYGDMPDADDSVRVQPGNVEISEIMSGSATWFADENGLYHDYVEIHNTSASPVNLNGWYLTDSVKDLARWQFPDVTIPADGYLAVHCSGNDRASDPDHLHSNFRIAAQGDVLVLTNPGGVSVSMVAPPPMETDQAYVKSASGWTLTMPPSPGEENSFLGDASAADEVLRNSASDVYINEILAASAESEDWVEIYNSGSQSVDISGWGLSDNSGRPRKWQFPEGTVIGAGKYLGIYCDGLDTSSGGDLHTSFSLAKAGGYNLTLSDPQGRILDRIFVLEQHSDISFGRVAGQSGLRYFTTATPGAANSGENYGGKAAPAQYSVRGGFHTRGETFTVSLSAQPGQRIRYTLDCTDPDENSPLYTQPITISDTTVLRTRVFADDCLPSYMDSCTYIYDVKNGNGSVYVLSLVSDPDNLVSAETGILVKGNHNNYWQKWEREAHVEVFDKQGANVLSQECAVRQQGQTSCDQPQQSLKLLARSEYGSGVFRGKIFSKRDYDWCTSFIMRTSNDDAYNTRMRDSVLSALANSTDDLLYQETEVCVAYINGKYWGHYNLRETANVDFICSLENWVGQEDEIDYVRGNSNLQQGSDETYQNLLAWVKKNSTATDEAYQVISSVIDVQNYIEYMVLEMFVGNTDPSDIKRYRNANDDGLWRWVLFDLDWAFSTDTNSISRWLTPGGMGNGGRTDNTLYIACMKNPTFRDQFLSHFGRQLATTFTPENMMARFQERYEVLKTILPDHHKRWDTSQDKYENELKKLVGYAKSRPGRLLQFFKYNSTLKISRQDFERYFGDAMQILGTNYDSIKRP